MTAGGSAFPLRPPASCASGGVGRATRAQSTYSGPSSAMFGGFVDRARSSTGHSTLLMDDPLHREGPSAPADADVQPRESSVVVMRLDDTQQGTAEKPSWYQRPEPEAGGLNGMALCRLGLHVLALVGLATGLVVIARVTKNRAIPFIYAVVAAFAAYEYAWLAYRARLRLYLPFKLHQKKTCRDIYGQIMNYSVDLTTCAITPWAERVCCGRPRLAALLVGVGVGGLGLLLAVLARASGEVIAYITTVAFLSAWCFALSPNLRDATILVCRYGYYTMASAEILYRARGQRDQDTLAVDLTASIFEPFHVLMAFASLILIVRAMSSKDPMETMAMALLDIAGLVYLGGLGNVVNYLTELSRLASVAKDNQALEDLVFAVFSIIWSAEVGGYVMERFLRLVEFPWNHPLTPRLSSRQNVETLVGALLCGAGASLLVSEVWFVNKGLPIKSFTLLIITIVSTIIAHVCKLWLISLKKVAKVSATGRYLCLSDGVIDRVDSLLIMTVVFVVVLRQTLRVHAE